MKSFHYEWYTVDIRTESGILTYEFKGRSRDSVIRQINKRAEYTNSDKNLSQSWLYREARMLEIFWDTLTLDRTGYQRRF